MQCHPKNRSDPQKQCAGVFLSCARSIGMSGVLLRAETVQSERFFSSGRAAAVLGIGTSRQNEANFCQSFPRVDVQVHAISSVNSFAHWVVRPW